MEAFLSVISILAFAIFVASFVQEVLDRFASKEKAKEKQPPVQDWSSFDRPACFRRNSGN